MTLTQDFRYALRSMRRHPGVAAVTILTIALGIAANTAVFSVVSAVLLTPLPYPDAGRLVTLVNTRGPRVFPNVSEPRFRIWREQTAQMDVVRDAAAYALGIPMSVSSGNDVEPATAGRVTAGFFQLFGAPVALGRTFTSDDDRPYASRTVVLSHGYWQRRFGGTAAILGRTLVLDGAPHVVVGVLAATFDARATYPITVPAPDVWVPLQLDPASRSDANYLFVAARLSPGVTLGAAQAHTQGVAVSAFRRAFPGVMPPDFSMNVLPLEGLVVGDVRASLWLLAASVAFVLLIACANTACLLLVRATARTREWAIRVATGASRGRVVRLLLIESLMLSLSGGALGLIVGVIGMRALLAMQPGDIPRIAADGSDVVMDWRVLVFTLVGSLVTGVAVGLLPAWRASRVDVYDSLKSGGDAAGSGPSHERTRALLVVAEVTLASVLLVGAALLMRSFVEMRRVHPGFETQGVLTMRTLVTDRRFETTMPTARMMEEGARAIGGVPGVEAVAATLTGLPLEGDRSALRIEIVGRESDRFLVGGWHIISPDYFAALRTPLVRGRAFTSRDDAASVPVVIVNETLARRLWPAEGEANARVRGPFDDRLRLGRGAGPEFEDVPRRVVGIVRDIRQGGLTSQPMPAVYVPLAQLPDVEMAFWNRHGGALSWIVRTRTADAADVVTGAMQHALGRATGARVGAVRSMDTVSASSTARPKFEMWLMTLFGAAALLLAALGVYGVAAYAVQQRTREIGIRLALGATAGGIRRAVLARGMTAALIGIVIGTTTALGLARVLTRFLFGVAPHDAMVFTIVPIALSAVALVAVWVPARRATRIEPIRALR